MFKNAEDDVEEFAHEGDMWTNVKTPNAVTRWRLRFLLALSEQLRFGFWSAPNRGCSGTVATTKRQTPIVANAAASDARFRSRVDNLR